MHNRFDCSKYIYIYLEITSNQLRYAVVVPSASFRGRHPRILESQSRCAEVRQNSGFSVAVREKNRCDCGNAVVGGSGHCWILGGDVHTKTGAVYG